MNRIFAQFLRVYLTKAIKNFLTDVPRSNGVLTMRALQQLFAPMTHIDMEKAKSELTALQMYRGELVTSFIQRFHAKLSAVQAMGSDAQIGLTQFKLALLFVQKLEKGVANTDQRVLVL